MVRNKIIKKGISTVLSTSMLLSLILSPIKVNAETSYKVETYEQVNNVDELVSMALDQSENKEYTYANSDSKDIVATQLIEKKTYANGIVEETYISDAFLIIDSDTDEKVTIDNFDEQKWEDTIDEVSNLELKSLGKTFLVTASSSTSKSAYQYNINARQSVNYTKKAVNAETFIHVNSETSSVTYSSTKVAYIKHGVKSVGMVLFGGETDNYTTNGVPSTGTSYTVSVTNSYYYRNNSLGVYFTYLYVQTGDGNSFEIDIDMIDLLDSGLA